jgi:hypothetical protein
MANIIQLLHVIDIQLYAWLSRSEWNAHYPGINEPEGPVRQSFLGENAKPILSFLWPLALHRSAVSAGPFSRYAEELISKSHAFTLPRSP